MAIKYQVLKFPIEKLGIMKKLTFLFNGEMVEVDYQNLKLIVINKRLCLSLKDDSVIFPLAGENKITSLFENWKQNQNL